MPAITVDNLTKSFGQTVALDDLSFRVEEGEVFGFLGPNGAGKSTTINIVLDFARPTAGEISVLGMDAQRYSRDIRQRTGVLPEGVELYDRLTARQHLEFAIDSKNADDDPEALLERVGLVDAIDRKAGGYSKGMAQRLMLAMALVGEPDLLILDEPSTGLDPNGAREMRDIVREESERGATVFFSSHIMEQVEAVCDRVGILRDGKMVAVDSVEDCETPSKAARRSASPSIGSTTTHCRRSARFPTSVTPPFRGRTRRRSSSPSTAPRQPSSPRSRIVASRFGTSRRPKRRSRTSSSRIRPTLGRRCTRDEHRYEYRNGIRGFGRVDLEFDQPRERPRGREEGLSGRRPLVAVLGSECVLLRALGRRYRGAFVLR